MDKPHPLLSYLFVAMSCILPTFLLPSISATESPSRFFPRKDLMTIGVYYNPEHWPSEQWERDFTNTEKMGSEFVHMGGFAWAFMEPEESRFDLAWLDRAIEIAARHHQRVVLCTPTPCPPAWTGEKYPEIFLVDDGGRRREHGSRGNDALADPTYPRFTERIVTELARRYGHNPAVWGWRLDNEPMAQPDYSVNNCHVKGEFSESIVRLMVMARELPSHNVPALFGSIRSIKDARQQVLSCMKTAPSYRLQLPCQVRPSLCDDQRIRGGSKQALLACRDANSY